MLTLDGEPLKKVLQSSSNNLGEKKLNQKFSNSPLVTIFKTGAGNAGVGQSMAIPNSNWEITFIGSNALLEQAEQAPTLWLVVLGCTTALSLFIALVLSRFLVKVEAEAEQKLAPTVAEVAKKSTTPAAEAAPSTLFQKQDILDIAVFDEDENILGLNDTRNNWPGGWQ